MNLSDMKPNQSAVITEIDSSAKNARRLYDLGFVKGQRVRCTDIAMSGSPIAYEVQKTKIALRKNDAMRVGVSL